MATDFFERQARARKSTVWLVVLFSIAVIGIVGATFLLTFVGIDYFSRQTSKREESVHIAGIAAIAALGLIVSGTLYKVIALRAGGGRSVAETVGGQQITPNTTEFKERRVLNVVEEMAIASGTPVPPVYILDEAGINAFAAGYSPSDAVVGVTRGAIDELNREQLQGVIAHEFSHILNGDMRMNIRMIGILHGILLIALMGRMLIGILRYSGGGRRRSSNGKGGGGQLIIVILVVGAALMLIGFIGSFCGGLIKAAVSRQREYLADASAVQFTRNPRGIAGALKRLGASSGASLIKNPNASIASHMYFGKGVFEGFTGLMATHPPLPKRILALEPTWNGVFPKLDKRVNPTIAREVAAAKATVTRGFAPAAIGTPATARSEVTAKEEVPVAVVQDAIGHIGDPEQWHRDFAAELIAQIDPVLVDSSHEPYSARALVFALLIDEDAHVRKKQINGLSQSIEPHVVETAARLYPRTLDLDARAKLPLLDMTLPALRSMSSPQYETFMKSFKQLADADDRYSLFEWVLAQILLRHLRPQFVRVRSPVTLYYSLKKLTVPVSVLLSTMARVGHAEQWVAPSFEAASAQLPGLPITLLPPSQCRLGTLDASLKQLTRTTAKLRGQLIDASVAAICADNHVKVKEAELLRGIADLLDCPVPPLVPSAHMTNRLDPSRMAQT